jgi:hypothetical protein
MCRPMVCFLESVIYLELGLHVPVACVITTSAVSSLPCFWEFHLLFASFFSGILLCSVIFVIYIYIYIYIYIFISVNFWPTSVHQRNTLTINPTRGTNFSNLFLE